MYRLIESVLCVPSLIMILCSSGLKSLQRLLKMGAYRYKVTVS